MGDCPFCGSDDLRFPMDDKSVAVCFGCLAAFEPETRANPECQLCDNCAFRPDSPERQDEWLWLQLLETTIEYADHPFHCHKNLKIKMKENGYSFLQPTGDESPLKPCAGWRAYKLAFDQGRGIL